MGTGLLCPACGHNRSQVSDTRVSRGGKSLRRRRTCYGCDYRWSTEERQVDRVRAREQGINFTIHLRINEDMVMVTGATKDPQVEDNDE